MKGAGSRKKNSQSQLQEQISLSYQLEHIELEQLVEEELSNIKQSQQQQQQQQQSEEEYYDEDGEDEEVQNDEELAFPTFVMDYVRFNLDYNKFSTIDDFIKSKVKKINDLNQEMAKNPKIFKPTIEEPELPTFLKSPFNPSKTDFGSYQDPNSILYIPEYEKGAYFDEIMSFLQPFMSSIEGLTITRDDGGIEYAVELMKKHFQKYKDEKNDLKKCINVKQIIVPYIELAVPTSLVLTYGKLSDDKLLVGYQDQSLEELSKLAVFSDLYDANKEAICSLIYSLVDQNLLCIPSVTLDPYPSCWNCEENFGTICCSNCKVAKYCQKSCKMENWPHHKRVCGLFQLHSKPHKCMVFS